MSFLDDLMSILQKPQSAAMGAYGGAMKWADRDSDPNNVLADDPLSGLLQGLKGNLRPHEVLGALKGRDPNTEYGLGNKILNTASDIAMDPTLAVGSAIKGGLLGTKAAKGAEMALSAGKVGSEAKIATHLARNLRRAYQGALATGEIGSGISAGLLGGIAENSLAKWGPSIIAKIMSRSPELSDEVGGAVSSAVQVADNNLDDLLGADPRAALAATRTRLSPLEGALAANPATSTDLSTIMRPAGRHFAGGKRFAESTPTNDLDDVFASALNTEPKKILLDPLIKNKDDVAAQLLELLTKGR